MWIQHNDRRIRIVSNHIGGQDRHQVGFAALGFGDQTDVAPQAFAIQMHRLNRALLAGVSDEDAVSGIAAGLRQQAFGRGICDALHGRFAVWQMPQRGQFTGAEDGQLTSGPQAHAQRQQPKVPLLSGCVQVQWIADWHRINAKSVAAR